MLYILKFTSMSETPFYTLDQLIELKAQGKLKKDSINVNRESKERVSNDSFRNVHVYDTHLKVDKGRCFEPEYKKQLFNKLYLLLSDMNAKYMVQIIGSDMNAIDTANKINPSDLLADILSYKMTVDMFFLLEEQLVDNFRLGQCQAGRSTRLLQIYNMMV